jgi:hypothetical protein
MSKGIYVIKMDGFPAFVTKEDYDREIALKDLEIKMLRTFLLNQVVKSSDGSDQTVNGIMKNYEVLIEQAKQKVGVK